jgi:hypothetical protein
MRRGAALRTVALAGLAVFTILPTFPLKGQEVGSATVVPIQVTGDPEVRFSMVVLGDGYTAGEQERFREHLDKHLNVLWSIEPFRAYRSYINVYAVEVVSRESGVTCDPEHREERDTPLGLNFSDGCTNPNARGILVNQDAAREYASLATPHFDQILVIANTDTYGGIGGRVATTSGGNAIGPLITPHEIGHSLGRLQDEYTYNARGVPGGHYDRDEPASIQHTLLTEEEIIAQRAKWWRWLGEESESGGVIGRYEGGMSNVTGVWRPSRHSMMISLGYYFDQISRERMTERISGQVRLIAASTPNETPVSRESVVWIETPYPVYHELDVMWRLNGALLRHTRNARSLDLAPLELSPGRHELSVTVVDPTDFVRDPAIRDSESLTATRTWIVDGSPVTPAPVPVAFTSWTQTERPVGGKDVVYVETTHPAQRVLTVTWHLNGEPVTNPRNGRSLPLGEQGLPRGTHTLTATVTDPANPAGESRILSWKVDNTPPAVEYTLSEPMRVETGADGLRHYHVQDQFTMKLIPSDDQPGYVVAEFRVNGDGWHHYYGWPDAPPGTPYLFTPRGTNIKELIYGSLSSEGLSPQPWEPREPGWGTHRIEYRAMDAAGNISEAGEFLVTVTPGPGSQGL